MTTMYYTYPEEKPIGQIHFKGKGKGTHFTWTMLPLDFAIYYHERREGFHAALSFTDEYNHSFDLHTFCEMIRSAKSQSFEEGLE